MSAAKKYSDEDTAAIVVVQPDGSPSDPRLYTSFLPVGDGVVRVREAEDSIMTDC